MSELTSVTLNRNLLFDCIDYVYVRAQEVINRARRYPEIK